MAADTFGEYTNDYFSILYSHLMDVNLFGLIKTFLFYVLVVACTIQTFYPAFMIIAMAIRQLGILAHVFHKVEEKSMRHGGELVAQVLKSHGVQNIFTLSGGHISPILVAAEKEGIRVVDTRHEVTTVFAADAISRLSGVPGVAVVTAGPGLTNVITALQNASLAESPLVVMCGCPALLLKGRGALQDIDQMSLVKSITKWRGTVTKVRDIVPIVREAFRQAQNGTPGPVLVEFPLDTLYPYPIVQKEVIASASSGKTLKSKLVNMYLQSYMKNLFAAAFDVERESKPWPVEIPFPKKNHIQQTIDLLKTAKKPLILFGSQAVLPPVGADQLSQLVKQLGIPCYLGGMSRGLLGKDAELHMRQNRKEALREADLVILAGTVCDFRLSYGKVLSPKSKIIAINRSKTQLYKNSDMFWKPTLAVQSDVGQFFLELAENLEKKNSFKVDPEWVKHLRERDQEKENKNEQQAVQKVGDKYLSPVYLLKKLEGIIDENTILVADGGDFVATASYILKPRKPLSWLDPGAFGTLGVGAGFALGAKLARPDANVVILYGDGSLGYSLMEFDTFVRHKIPVTAIIGNDACWTQIAREQVPVLGSDVACKLDYTNYEQAVLPFGANGYKVDGTTSEQDLLKTIEEAINKTKGENGKPALVNCMLGKSSFREGSVSV